jgi:hypothetical protein
MKTAENAVRLPGIPDVLVLMTIEFSPVSKCGIAVAIEL